MKGKTSVGGALIVVGLLAIAAWVAVQGGYIKMQVTPEEEKKISVPGVECSSLTTPDWDPEAYDVNNPNLGLTESTNIYREKGTTKWISFTQGTDIQNLAVGKEYEFVFGISATDFVDNAYGPYGSFVVPCAEKITGWYKGKSDVGLYQDAVSTSLTATFYNEDGNADYQPFSAGETHVVELKWVAPNKLVCGNPYIAESGISGNDPRQRAEYPNVLCLELNTTTMDKPLYVRIKSSGVEMRSLSVPIRHSGTTGKTTYCYEAPVITDKEVRFQVALDADDTNAPTSDDTAYLYCGNFYVNSKTNELSWGVETEEGSPVGTSTPDTLTLDFTA